METISKREFWLGMSIISLCMILSNMLYPPILESTAEIKIREVIICTTSKEGVVNCQN